MMTKLIGRVRKAGASFVPRLFNNTVLERLAPWRALLPFSDQRHGFAARRAGRTLPPTLGH